MIFWVTSRTLQDGFLDCCQAQPSVEYSHSILTLFWTKSPEDYFWTTAGQFRNTSGEIDNYFKLLQDYFETT